MRRSRDERRETVETAVRGGDQLIADAQAEYEAGRVG